MMIRTTAIIATILFTTAARAEVPTYIYTPCLTSAGDEPTLNATAFAENMQEAGFKQVTRNRKVEWDATYKIKRAMVYRYVGATGEATCVVEVTRPPAHTQLPSAPLNPVQAP